MRQTYLIGFYDSRKISIYVVLFRGWFYSAPTSLCKQLGQEMGLLTSCGFLKDHVYGFDRPSSDSEYKFKNEINFQRKLKVYENKLKKAS